MESDTESDSGINLFEDPEGFYKPDPLPTTARHTLGTGEVLTLNLVGHNPLWGHLLWNAGRLLATYLEQRPHLYKTKSVLELGAGAGLPSLICAIGGASKVVVTDYPDPDLVRNLQLNIATCSPLPRSEDGNASTIVAEGYLWGGDTSPLLSHITQSKLEGAPKFDLLILADLLFNHSEHAKLVRTIELTLTKEPQSVALVFFTPYRPWLLEKDLAFFDLAREAGLTVTKVFEEEVEKVMFETDPGDEKIRRTVFGYEVRWDARE